MSRKRFHDLSEADRQKMITLSRDHEVTARDIAKRYGVSLTTVQTFLARNGCGHGSRKRKVRT